MNESQKNAMYRVRTALQNAIEDPSQARRCWVGVLRMSYEYETELSVTAALLRQEASWVCSQNENPPVERARELLAALND